jgi:endonuclease I
MKKNFLLFYFIWLFCNAFSQIPQDYYNNAQGKIQQELKTALSEIITAGHTSNTYGSLWIHFQKTDKHPSGVVWDMYSNCGFQFVTNQCGNYASECDCYNREHSIPSSWFGGEVYPMYADLHHLVPVDGWANGKRSNYPFGRVGSVSWTSLNGSKLGTSNYPGYTGSAFEPIDQFKGDFARIVFYMVTRYEDYLAAWQTNDVSASAVLDGAIWPAFNQWAKELYLQWHEQDPVDHKELMRNDTVFSIQNNRNPFIDHPEFARQIWGPDAGMAKPIKLQLSIFPQPATDVLHVNSAQTVISFEIIDITGNTISKNEVYASSFQIDVSAFMPGIYIIRAVSDAGFNIVKFMKL